MEDTEGLSDRTLFPGGRRDLDPDLRFLFCGDFYDILRQREFWRDRRGNVWRIEEMGLRHRRNLIAWFERNAGQVKNAVEWPATATPGPTAAYNAQTRPWETDPRDWLDAQPLIRRLRKVQRKQAGL